ncbi:hypothetical protein [Pseudomonas baetica]|uniref:hypothetical protein n=1 Tax=Pseudomonas baetica TaxID=674054 RepID=UPI0024076CFF|nr:hypothetical protein [Pseudomonas baetica]MDF9779065.1 hypothetical protein [Pseudomonas baetica]
MSCETETFIREAAAKRWSRTMTHKALGLSQKKFALMLAAMPPIEWPAPGHSAACDAARRTSPAMQAARVRGGHTINPHYQRDAFGKRNTLRGFAAEYGMSYETLRRRMLGGGRTLEEALALPLNSRQAASEAQ